jgi:1,4-dihydroxy-2-naphthoyl-CoA synthase
VDGERKEKRKRKWKEVWFECVEREELRMEKMCGIKIVVNEDEIEDLIN